jgi:outer membrane protein TolC
MKTHFFTLLLTALLPVCLPAADTLRIEDCRRKAVEASPQQQRKALAEQVFVLQQENIRSNNLPKINLGAQASWQSDVFGLPIESPLFKVPQVPKDQYKITLDASERIWDNRLNQALQTQKNLEKDIALAQSDVDAYQVRESVTDLFCKILLLQESEALLLTAQTDLEQRLKQTQGAIDQGTMLRTAADQIRIQIFKTEQQIASLRADKSTLSQLLGLWTGLPISDQTILAPPTPAPSGGLNWNDAPLRPEYRLIDLQQKNLLLQEDLLRIKSRPRLDAFLQSGMGRPNPFNFFETGFQPFVLVGLRASWTPIDWGNTRRDKQMVQIQAQQFDIQRNAFQQRLQAGLLRDHAEMQKFRDLLRSDDAIIALQEDILRRADAQLKNGVMTMTDYLAQSSLLTQARLSRKTHEIQAMQAHELFLAKSEN